MAREFIDYMDMPEGVICSDVKPDDEILLRGIRDGELFESVPVDYGQGLINHTHIIEGYMIREYGNDEEWDQKCKNVDSLKDEFHTDIGDYNKFANIIILAESESSYWYFSDTHDAKVDLGRFKKYGIDKEYVKELFFIFAVEGYLDEEREKITDIKEYYKGFNQSNHVKKIPASYFTGWITL